MPPCPTWFRGHQAIRGFLVRYPLTHPWKHLPARANGQLAVGGYVPGPEHGGCFPAALDVLTLDGGQIAAVTSFLTAETLRYLPAATLRPPHPGGWLSGADLFPRFGLPARLP
jgi:RNA polymerase sigma-70 factor (ECF subfamily)